MKQFWSISLIIFLASAASPSAAQTAAPRNFVAQTDLPAGNGAWVVQVFTTGGFLGTGAGDYAATSDGQLLCSSLVTQCPKQIEVSGLHTLVEMIQDAAMPQVLPIFVCNDCLTRTIVVRRRDSMGIEHRHTASWNDLTRASVPREILQIYDALAALRK